VTRRGGSSRTKKRSPPVPRCRICDHAGGRATAEDAYPWWLRRRIHEWVRALPQGSVAPGWEQGRRVLLRPVCEKCQRQLNQTFETPAHGLLKAMMDGSALDLAPREQVLVAAWAAKTALVLILQRTSPTQGWKARLLQGHLRDMLKHGSPPVNATVRFAYLSDRLEQTQRRLLPRGWPELLPAGDSIVSVISVPGFIAETIVAPPAIVHSFIELTKDDDRFTVAWPPHLTSQRWPPPVTMGLLDSEASREAWGHTDWHGNFPVVAADPLIAARRVDRHA
jgi:hypothetical protein